MGCRVMEPEGRRFPLPSQMHSVQTTDRWGGWYGGSEK